MKELLSEAAFEASDAASKEARGLVLVVPIFPFGKLVSRILWTYRCLSVRGPKRI